MNSLDGHKPSSECLLDQQVGLLVLFQIVLSRLDQLQHHLQACH